MLRDYIALFGAGVASFLAPCVVPLVPAYLGMVAGESADAHDASKAVPATAIFVLGFAVVFSSFGVIAGIVGRSLTPEQAIVERVGGLGAALVVAAHSRRPVEGGLLLVSYALGIGVPFLLASLGLASSPRLSAWLRRTGPKMERFAGGVMVLLGVLLVTGAYKWLTSYLARFSPALGGL